jgi:hypothetical protein
MRSGVATCFAIAISAFGVFAASPAYAQREPVIVVPGRAGIPVMVWGQDVSGAVIEGDFGLDRPGFGITVIPPIGPYYAGIPPQPPIDGYYPKAGTTPRIGRDEVVPPADRPLPPAAESYHRSWSSQLPNLPPTVYPPYEPPPVILAPQVTPPATRPPRGP